MKTAMSASFGDQPPKASASVGERPSSKRRRPSSTICVQASLMVRRVGCTSGLKSKAAFGSVSAK
jgi:hypothetical protein